jgi:hypothetical protein
MVVSVFSCVGDILVVIGCCDCRTPLHVVEFVRFMQGNLFFSKVEKAAVDGLVDVEDSTEMMDDSNNEDAVSLVDTMRS